MSKPLSQSTLERLERAENICGVPSMCELDRIRIAMIKLSEGGLGCWRGNRFRYGPPKFSMNATPQRYGQGGLSRETEAEVARNARFFRQRAA